MNRTDDPVKQTLQFHGGHDSDRSTVRIHSSVVPNDADLNEPFERVRDALNETLRSATSR